MSSLRLKSILLSDPFDLNINIVKTPSESFGERFSIPPEQFADFSSHMPLGLYHATNPRLPIFVVTLVFQGGESLRIAEQSLKKNH
jgi:hypothetical protein